VASLSSNDAPKTTLREDLTALLQSPRELWLVYLATFLEYLGIFSFLQTLPLWLSSDFHMDDRRAGWWAATFSTLVTLFVFMVGTVADLVGVRRMLMISFSLAALTRLGMSLAPTTALAIAMLLAFGFAYASTSPVLQTAVHRATSKRARAFAFSLWYVSFNLSGTLVGPMIDGTRRHFLDPATHHLAPRAVTLPLLGERVMTAHAAILGLGFVFAALAAVVMFFLRKDFEKYVPADDGPPQPEAPRVSPLRALREVFTDRTFWKFLFLLSLLSLVKMMFQHMHFTWPKYVTRELGDEFPVGTIWSINSFLILFLAPLGTALTRNRRPLDVLLLGAFISAASPFVLCFGSSIYHQVAMILVLTIGEALWSPRLYEYNLSVAPRGREATYVSLAALPTFFAKFLVGPTSGYLLARYCPPTGPRTPAVLWAIIGVSTMLGPIGVLYFRNWITRKDEPAAPPATP
jgi:MFS family permease